MFAGSLDEVSNYRLENAIFNVKIAFSFVSSDCSNF
jgi:hypothetical protein